MKKKKFLGDPRFLEILEKMKKIHSQKSADYGCVDPLTNLRLCDLADIPPWKGVVVRLSDKMARLYSFCRKGKLQNEPVEDTFYDLSNYAILGLILYLEWKESNEKKKIKKKRKDQRDSR